MKQFYCLTVIGFLLTATSPQAFADDSISLEVFSGVVYNVSTPITIRDDGQEDLTFTADYDTEPFQDAPYYGLRVSYWQGETAWELELIHHKLILTNGPPEIDSFEITHGYNLFTVNRAWKFETGILHIGAGFVFTHEELVLRGTAREFNDGIIPDREIAGPTLQAAFGRRFEFGKGVYGFLEAKMTATYASIEFENGSADVPNVAFHLIFGLGFDYLLGEK